MGGDGKTIIGLRGSIPKNINVYKNIIKSKKKLNFIINNNIYIIINYKKIKIK